MSQPSSQAAPEAALSLLEGILTAITQPGATDNSATPLIVPRAWNDTEQLVLPDWRTMSTLPAGANHQCGPWDDALTPDGSSTVAPSGFRSPVFWWPSTLPPDQSGPTETQVLPRNPEARRQYAYTLYCALTDFRTGFVERPPGDGNKHPNRLLSNLFTQQFVQERCYYIVERMLLLHAHGAILQPADDATARRPSSRYERSHSFETRFTELCISVTHFKNLATDLLGNNVIDSILYAPVLARSEKMRNSYQNEERIRFRAHVAQGGNTYFWDHGMSYLGSTVRRSLRDPSRGPAAPPLWCRLPQPQPGALRAAPAVLPAGTVQTDQESINQAVSMFFTELERQVGSYECLMAVYAAASRNHLPLASPPVLHREPSTVDTAVATHTSVAPIAAVAPVTSAVQLPAVVTSAQASARDADTISLRASTSILSNDGDVSIQQRRRLQQPLTDVVRARRQPGTIMITHLNTRASVSGNDRSSGSLARPISRPARTGPSAQVARTNQADSLATAPIRQSQPVATQQPQYDMMAGAPLWMQQLWGKDESGAPLSATAAEPWDMQELDWSPPSRTFSKRGPPVTDGEDHGRSKRGRRQGGI